MAVASTCLVARIGQSLSLGLSPRHSQENPRTLPDPRSLEDRVRWAPFPRHCVGRREALSISLSPMPLAHEGPGRGPVAGKCRA